jgi:hypothetical protein
MHQPTTQGLGHHMSWVHRWNNREAKQDSTVFLNRIVMNFKNINSDLCIKINSEVELNFAVKKLLFCCLCYSSPVTVDI